MGLCGRHIRRHHYDSVFERKFQRYSDNRGRRNLCNDEEYDDRV